MVERQTLHIFRDGNSGPFGYTEDSTGGNLPTLTPGRTWAFHSTIEVTPGEGPRAGMDIEDIQAEIKKHGVCVKEKVITVQKP
jgi:hypothetical protein